jgi:hypothetical protein
MKRILRILSVILVLGALGFWYAKGANSGWTKTSVFNETVDEVTGIKGRFEEKAFIPGLDFLAMSFGAASLLAGASFLFRNRNNQSQTTNS